jgi:meso-butanediol dehydrogenase/(S,S)-butanediol dehydrogenase/diacetyl reductase
MGTLQNKVALITGAGRASGIGAAVARRLAAGGADVVVSDLCAPVSNLLNAGSGQWEELQAVAAEVATVGVRALPVRCDVTQADSVAAMIRATLDAFGRLDILVNNAGATIGPAPVVQMAEEAWRRTLEINATGTFLCCKAAVPVMIQGGRGGRVINMSSLAALRPKPYMSAYAASKAAIVALTQGLAQEVAAYGITVNALLPGDIDTAFKQWGMQVEAAVTQRPLTDVVGDIVRRIPTGRLGMAEDVAHLAAWLASEEAAFITGQAINVTGGRELT